MTKTPNYGKSFEFWRANCVDAWQAYTQHKFVEGIENGTLPRTAFLYYLRQDFIFLKHFARAWALAIVKSHDLVEMEAAASIVNALISDEIKLHIRICGDEGINETELLSTIEAPENLAYTRYVLEVGYTGTFVDLMAVLAPCIMGYGEIGHRLGKSVKSTPYSDWIAAYAGDDYQSLCSEVGMLIDRALIRRYGDEIYSLPFWGDLCSKFEIATKLEVNFWEMGLNS